MKTLLFCLFLAGNACFLSFSKAQSTVRVRVLDEKELPLKGVRLTFSGTVAPVSTQSNGEFNLEFPAGQMELIFFPPSDFERISPPKGSIFLPADAGRTVEIWLARKGSTSREAETFARVLSKKEAEKAGLQAENERLRSSLFAAESGGKNVDALRDSLQKNERASAARAAELAREIADLREAVDLRKQLFYQKITGDLALFADRAKDLRDVLPRAADAFIDEKAGKRLENAISKYNSARDSLLQNGRGHVEIGRALFGPEAAERLAEAVDFALVEVHQNCIFSLNAGLLEPLRAVRAEEMRPAKARKKAEKAARSAHEKLAALLPVLDKNNQAAFRKMEAASH